MLSPVEFPLLLALAGWPAIFSASGLDPSGVTIVEGDSPAAREHGFRATAKKVDVRGVTEERAPKLQIVWERPLTLPVFETPPGAQVFTREKWTGAPLAAGFKKDGKAVLWTAAPPGERGYERFPYLPQALLDLGLAPRVESRSLWAFFDSSYRLRADPDYLAARWRKGGIAALHAAAWHYWEPDPERDRYLARLIEACHRRAILVYAWIEFPHVSERFWDENPQWREKTAAGQDAHLDWRKLMNLADPDCARAIARGLDNLAARFDWDGLNLGELYFESLEGWANPARFTPFNATVREEFRRLHGFDPLAIYDAKSPHFHAKSASGTRFLTDFRASLADRLQREWIGRMAGIRRGRPHLDLVLTHIDDRFDQSMREKLGADAARLVPFTEQHGVTFLVEDPATVWHLGPERYEEIAKRYQPIAKRRDLLAIDINIVERYQDVYPVKQQTGVELFQLVNRAAKAFSRVALYFENSILPPDWPLLAAAAAAPKRVAQTGGAIEIESDDPLVLRWSGGATVNGEAWPAGGEDYLLLPAGKHRVARSQQPAARWLADFNGRLLRLWKERGQWWVEYESRSRALAVFADGRTLPLPPGRRREAIGPVN
jgi:hypothetical protein